MVRPLFSGSQSSGRLGSEINGESKGYLTTEQEIIATRKREWPSSFDSEAFGAKRQFTDSQDGAFFLQSESLDSSPPPTSTLPVRKRYMYGTLGSEDKENKQGNPNEEEEDEEEDPDVLAEDIIRKAIDDANNRVILEGLGLRSVPESINSLKNLVVREGHGFSTSVQLLLANNCLTSLPYKLFDVTNLTVLILRGNQLEAIPPAIGKLQQLYELNVANNLLTNLPSEILDLKHLELLHLNPNPFHVCPDATMLEEKTFDISAGLPSTPVQQLPNSSQQTVVYGMTSSQRDGVVNSNPFSTPVRATHLAKGTNSFHENIPLERIAVCEEFLVPRTSNCKSLKDQCLEYIVSNMIHDREDLYWDLPEQYRKMISTAKQCKRYNVACGMCKQLCVREVVSVLEWWSGICHHREICVRRVLCSYACHQLWTNELSRNGEILDAIET